MSNRNKNLQRSARAKRRFLRDLLGSGPRTERYEKFEVSGFRAISGVKLERMSWINILLGNNNVGKTSVMEALYLHACGFNCMPAVIRLGMHRTNNKAGNAFDFVEKMSSAFTKDTESINLKASLRGIDKPVVTTFRFKPSIRYADINPKYTGEMGDLGDIPNLYESSTPSYRDNASNPELDEIADSGGYIGEWQVEINGQKRITKVLNQLDQIVGHKPFKLAKWHDFHAHREPDAPAQIFGTLKRHKLIPEFTASLKEVFPNIIEFDYYPFPNGSPGPVYASVAGQGDIPIYAFGDGTRRLFDVVGQMVVHKKALHCVEEADACFHPKAQPTLAHKILKFAKQFGNQLVMSTHDLEFTEAFLKAVYEGPPELFKDTEEPIMVYRLVKDDKGHVDVWPLTGREALKARLTQDLELR